MGTSEPVAPPITTSIALRTDPTPSTALVVALSITSVPSSIPGPSTVLARSTTSAAKSAARVPSNVVLEVPATDSRASRSSVPLAPSLSGEDARNKAKGKAHKSAASDHWRSEPLGDDERDPKRTRTDLSSPTVRMLQLVFDDDATAAHLFATVVFSDDAHTRVRASSSRTMSRTGLNKRRADNHTKGELTTRTERTTKTEQLNKRYKEFEKAFGDNAKLYAKNEKLTKELETTKTDASNSLLFLAKRKEQIDELIKQVEQKRKLLKIARALIVDLHEMFDIAKARFVELKGDPQDEMIFQVQREAHLDFVKQLLGLIPGREAPKFEDELASLTADVEASVGDEEYFDKLMESLEECFNVVLPEGVCQACVSEPGPLQEMRIDTAGLLKKLMISKA
ncbi:hypothetical protein AALP_AA7G169900 [Arabis alpina]|uniref:Uncharacterized protein n=1 Tax=Arabis alpina TaxID=50452 RepID=A0A087GIL8_ARAAL|nr:hypothetical protein AALP_AA7G169900 [Arabis alpina]